MHSRDRGVPGVARAAVGHRRRVPPPQLVGGVHRCGGRLRPARRHAQLRRRAARHRCRFLALRQGAAQAQAPHRCRRLPLPQVGVKRGVPKATVASPPVMHYFLGPQAFERAVYPDREAFFSDLVKLYRDEIADLAAEGCTYLQLDDTALPCNCDAHAREDVAARGENADELTERYVRLVNDSIAGKPAGMTVATHLCRGNLKGAWMAQGGYEPVADALFNRLNAEIYCLEYDSAVAGDFSPLRFVPKGKRVILGLVSTKTPGLEAKDFLKKQIAAASKYVPLDRLGISPQCGFSSAGGGGQVPT